MRLWRDTWRKLPLTIFLALVSLSLPLRHATPSSADTPASDPRFGAVQAIEAPDRAAEAGVRWERIMFPWAVMQPNSSDEMLPSFYSDARIEAQAKRGVTQVGVIVYTPNWASTDPSRGWGAVPKNLDLPVTDDRNAWAKFVSRLATKYRGTVDNWIIWNEPDLVDLNTRISPNWAGSEQDFWALQKSGYMAIKSANPDARVMLPGFSHWHSKEIGVPQYLKRLLDVGANDASAPQNNWYFDGVPTHAYGNPLNSFALPLTYRRILAERGLEQKPIWVVEANLVPWDDPSSVLSRDPWRGTMNEQATFVVESYALGLAAGLERMSVYKMTDEVAEDGQFYGLIRKDGSPRPAYQAFKTMAGAFAGTKKATLTWDGSASPLSLSDQNSLLDSLQPHYQFVCPCRAMQVSMELDHQRITVIWNTGPKPVMGLVTAATTQATVLDQFGRSRGVQAQDGTYRLYLGGARDDTEPRDSTVRLVGGQPSILIEDIPDDARPSTPPRVAPAMQYDGGFAIANAQFEDYLRNQGGVSATGLPISREMDFRGAPIQIFQRQVLQLQEDGSVTSIDPLNASSRDNAGQLLRAVMTGQDLSNDQERRYKDDPLFKQYDPGKPQSLARPEALTRSNLKYAFEPD